MTKNIIFLILIALVVIFVLQNTEIVAFRFLAWTISMSRALLLFLTFAIGIVVGWLAGRIRPKAHRKV
jgi:putative membrane protein